MNLDYFVGLLNSDGHIIMIYKKDATMTLDYRLQPQIEITQSGSPEGITLLLEVQEFLKSIDIKSQYRKKALIDSSYIKNQKRADSILIAGIEQVKLTLKLIESSTTGLIGLKFYDFLLMKEMFSIIEQNQHNTLSGRAQILDLREALHKPPALPSSLKDHYLELEFPPREIKELPKSNCKDRFYWEKVQKLGSGSSIGAAQKVMKDCEKGYIDQALKISTNSNIVSFSPDTVSGLIDGNGCLYKKDNRHSFSISFPTGNESLFELLSQFFNDNAPRIYSNSGSLSYQINRRGLISILKEHIKNSKVMRKNWK